MIKYIFRSIRNFWFNPSSGLSESLLRISYSLFLLCDLSGIYPKLDLLFSNIGVHPYTKLDPFYTSSIIHIVFWIWIIDILLFLFGFFTKITSILNFIFATYFFGMRGFSAPHGGDWAFQAMGFYLMFMKCNLHFTYWTHFKVNKTINIPPATWPIRLAQLHFMLIYFTAGISKLADPGWLNGIAFKNTLQSIFITYFVPYDWILHADFMLKLINYFIIFWEICLPVLILVKPIRKIVLLSMIFFHVGIDLTLRVGWFSEAMLMGILLYLDDVKFSTKWVTLSATSHISPSLKLTKLLKNIMIIIFLTFHLSTVVWVETLYILKSHIDKSIWRTYFYNTPVLTPYIRYITRMEYYDVFPSSLFLDPVIFLMCIATNESKIDIPLPPFDSKGDFAPGLRYVKEVREGILMFRIAHFGLNKKQWEAYIKHLINRYNQMEEKAYPPAIKIYRICYELKDLQNIKTRHVFPRELLVTAIIYPTLKDFTIQLKFTALGQKLLR